MSDTSDRLLDNLREMLSAVGPALVTQDDLERVADRVTEIEELLDELESRLD